MIYKKEWKQDLSWVPHHVYRYYDTDGRILYIGCSAQLDARDQAHRRKAPWFHLVARRTHQTYVNRSIGLSAERALIKVHRPPYNTAMRKWPIAPDLAKALQELKENPPADPATAEDDLRWIEECVIAVEVERQRQLDAAYEATMRESAEAQARRRRVSAAKR